MSFKSTIFALSSGLGKCGVSVIRISGPNSRKVMFKMTRLRRIPLPNVLRLQKIYCPLSQELLDQALIVWFKAPKSSTGEDVVELHVHGGVSIVNGVLEALSTIDGLRHAEPGEFTKRSFINNKLNLYEVEALGDLIESQTKHQRQQALKQLNEGVSGLFEKWRYDLIQIATIVEANIDFAEDQHIDSKHLSIGYQNLLKLRNEMSTHLKNYKAGECIREGVKVAIVGSTNVGKSSLFNYLCKKPAAIVSSTPGTTRDVLERMIDVSGYPVVLKDLAGIRQTTDDVELEGTKRAIQSALTSDVLILVLDPSEYHHFMKLVRNEESTISCSENANGGHLRSLFSNFVSRHLVKLQLSLVFNQTTNSEFSIKTILIIFNKIDLYISSNCTGKKDNFLLKHLNSLHKFENINFTTDSSENTIHGRLSLCSISVTKNLNMEMFWNQFENIIRKLCTCSETIPSFPGAIISNTRQKELLSQTVQSLTLALKYIHYDNDDVDMNVTGKKSNECLTHNHIGEDDMCYDNSDIVAHHVRSAASSLGKLTGAITTEDILDSIFSKFCIGK